jgi:hypothetical protein
MATKPKITLTDILLMSTLAALSLIAILLMRPTDKDTLTKCMKYDGYAVIEGTEQYLNAGYMACKIVQIPNSLNVQKKEFQIAGSSDNSIRRTWEGK